MHNDDPWLALLGRQAAVVESARLDLEDSRRANWKVLKADLALQSAEAAYHRHLTDAPRLSVLRHLRERVDGIRA